jgi:hypothetical protein
MKVSLLHRNPAYREYKQRTSPIVPLPPALYTALPSCIKMTLLFEFPIYNKLNYQGIE